MGKTLGELNFRSEIEIPVVPEWQMIMGKTIVFEISDKNHPGYPENSVTLSAILPHKMAFDAKEPRNSITERRKFGNNRYIYSNIHQWLNSTAGGGQWYSPQHSTDEPPSRENVYEGGNPYVTWAGFLSMLDYKFVSNLLNTNLKVTAFNTSSSSSDTSLIDNFTAKVFLPAKVEAGIVYQEWERQEGYVFHSLSTEMYQFFRTIGTSRFGESDEVSIGKQAIQSAYRPEKIGIVCNLPQSFQVSDTTNERGHYTLYSKPKITAQTGDLGERANAFSYAYRISQGENLEVTVKEMIDDTVIRTRTAVPLNQEIYFNISKETFKGLSNGQHTIKIVAETKGMKVESGATFTKRTITGFNITLKNPVESAEQPKRCNITVARSIPAGGTFHCEVTNNPFDSIPTWEDCTEDVKSNLIHVFRNGANSSSRYGLNVRVTVERGTAESECWVSSIGGAFD